MAQTSSTGSTLFLRWRNASLFWTKRRFAASRRRRKPGASPARNWRYDGLLDPVKVDIVETLLAPDQVVPGYQILDLIAQGGMGVVYPRQKSLDRVVAIKTILVSQMHNHPLGTRSKRRSP